MGWTKADRERFLASCNEATNIMPTEVIKRQQSLFEDVVEVESNIVSKYQRIRLVLKYPPLDTNLEGNPVAKQSARFMAARHFNGPKKGEPVIYINRQGKPDVIIKSYQDAKIVTNTKMLQEQIIKQLREQKAHKYKDAIFVTRMEFIFKHRKDAPQYMLNDLKENNKIYFKDTKPDLDNLEKLVWDSMQIPKLEKDLEKLEEDMKDGLRGLVYDNDAQIVSKNGIFKRWGLRPGCIIEMEGYIS